MMAVLRKDRVRQLIDKRDKWTDKGVTSRCRGLTDEEKKTRQRGKDRERE